MAPVQSEFVGQWDVYTGPMHSELQLDSSGNYRHSLWSTARQHWGTWSLEIQNNTTFLVLTLHDAFPRVEAGRFGWLQVQWPAYEAWAVMQVEPARITLSEAVMVRKMAVAKAPPTYVPTNVNTRNAALPFPAAPAQMPTANARPIQPVAVVSPPFPTLPAQPIRAPQVPPAAQLQNPGSSASPQSVLEQWKTEHANWDAVRKVMAETLQNDKETTRKINDMYVEQQQSEIGDQLKHSREMSQIIHDNTEAFIRYIKS